MMLLIIGWRIIFTSPNMKNNKEVPKEDDLVDKSGLTAHPFQIEYMLDNEFNYKSQIVRHKNDGNCFLCHLKSEGKLTELDDGTTVFMFNDRTSDKPSPWAYRTLLVHDHMCHFCWPVTGDFDIDTALRLSSVFDSSFIKMEETLLHERSMSEHCHMCAAERSGGRKITEVEFLYGQDQVMNWEFTTEKIGDSVHHISLRPTKQIQ